MKVLHPACDNVFRTPIVPRPTAVVAKRFGHGFTIPSTCKPSGGDALHPANKRDCLDDDRVSDVRVLGLRMRTTK